MHRTARFMVKRGSLSTTCKKVTSGFGTVRVPPSTSLTFAPATSPTSLNTAAPHATSVAFQMKVQADGNA
jgi:hypothetical protein